MIDKLKNKLINPRYYVVGIYQTDNIPEYQLLKIYFKDGELKIEDKLLVSSLDTTAKDFFKKNYPILLHIEGDNVVNKVVDNEPGYRNNVIFKASPDDFYFFEYFQEKEVYLSVVRKSIIQDFCKQISDLGGYVLHLSFGPFVLVNILDNLKGYSQISSPKYSLKIDSNTITAFTNTILTSETYRINEDILNNYELPLIATFLNYKFPKDTLEFDTNFLAENKSEFKFKNAFKMAGIFTLVFFLTALFVSDRLLNKYLSDLAEIQSTYALSQQTINEISELKEEKQLKEAILQTSGVIHESFITRYIADIGNSVPEGIELDAIGVIPLQKKIRPVEKINFESNTISVSGATTNDNYFNAWVQTLKALKWIKKLDITNYNQENRLINSFTIKIKI